MTIDHAQCFMLNHLWACTMWKTVCLKCKSSSMLRDYKHAVWFIIFVWLKPKSECWQILVKILKTGPVGLLSYMWTSKHDEASSCFLHQWMKRHLPTWIWHKAILPVPGQHVRFLSCRKVNYLTRNRTFQKIYLNIKFLHSWLLVSLPS